MKKLFASIFFVFILIIFSSSSLTAQESSKKAESVESVAPSAEQAEKSQYDLPYPGILPDNPLYIFKMFRDKIVSILISDPLKKAEFDLLNSDKRISAGAALIGHGKDKVALDTISKSNNYFNNAITEAAAAQKAGHMINPFIDKLKSSRAKHEEIIEDVQKKIDKQYKGQMQTEYRRIEEFEKRISALPKK